MRVCLPLGRSLFALSFFAFSMIALLPLRVALDTLGFERLGVTARAATGSVWAGALQEAQAGPVALGDVRARLNLLPLFLGRARLSLSSGDEAAPFEGALLVSRGGFGFEDVTGRFRLGALATLPLTTLDLQDVSAGFEAGRCVRAEGRARAAAAGQLAGLGLGSGLGGNVRCAGEALLLPLVSQSGMEQLNLRLSADGAYRAELLVRSADAGVRARLEAAGFRAAGSGHVLRFDGSF